jgi:uncharacterized protein YpmS
MVKDVNYKKILGFIALIAFVVIVVSVIVLSVQQEQANLEKQMKDFEARLPSNVTVRNAVEGGWSNDYHIKDEQVFLATMKLYGITEVWRSQHGSYCEYSFVFDSVVYYFTVGDY